MTAPYEFSSAGGARRAAQRPAARGQAFRAPGTAGKRLARRVDTRLAEIDWHILVGIANGYSTKMLSRQLEMPSRTIERRLDAMRLAMHARNRVHLVTRAWSMGLLSKDDLVNG